MVCRLQDLLILALTAGLLAGAAVKTRSVTTLCSARLAPARTATSTPSH
jgi:hypothetical protein